MSTPTKESAPVLYPKLHPWKLEPHYCNHVSHMTSEGLDGKAEIAEQLAWRDWQLAALRRIVARALACGQMEKLEDARDYLCEEAALATLARGGT